MNLITSKLIIIWRTKFTNDLPHWFLRIIRITSVLRTIESECIMFSTICTLSNGKSTVHHYSFINDLLVAIVISPPATWWGQSHKKTKYNHGRSMSTLVFMKERKSWQGERQLNRLNSCLYVTDITVATKSVENQSTTFSWKWMWVNHKIVCEYHHESDRVSKFIPTHSLSATVQATGWIYTQGHHGKRRSCWWENGKAQKGAHQQISLINCDKWAHCYMNMGWIPSLRHTIIPNTCSPGLIHDRNCRACWPVVPWPLFRVFVCLLLVGDEVASGMGTYV